MSIDDSPAKKRRKKSLSSGVPVLRDAVKSDVVIPTDEISEGGLFAEKELWLIQLPKEVSHSARYYKEALGRGRDSSVRMDIA